MRRFIMFLTLAPAMLLFSSASALFAQQTGMSSYSEVNWIDGKMVINVETTFAPGSESLRMRDNSEEFFKKNFFNIFMDSIKKDKYGPLYYNSSFTIDEMIRKTPDMLSSINDINNNIIKVFSVYNQDMAGVRMQYKLDIYSDIGRYFIKHKIPVKPEKTFIWVPSAKYSGVVIYAKGEYPLHGENIKGTLPPALFPTVYDERMRKIISMEMVSPEFLKKWGCAAYFSDPSDPGIKERAGDKPFYTMASSLFGRNRTDIVIPVSDADKLLYRGRNERLITEGRFVIIHDLPASAP